MLSIENLRPAFEFSPKPCIILMNDAPRYTIVYVNRAFIKEVDCFVDTMIGKGLFEAFPADDTHKAFIVHLFTSRTTNEQIYPIVDKNKTVQFFMYCPYDINEFLAGSKMRKDYRDLHDVLKNKTNTDELYERNDILERVTNALFRNEQRFKSLVQEGADMIAIIDAHGRCMYMSPTIEKVLQVAPEFFIGREAAAYIHPDDRKRVYKEFLLIKQQKRIFISPYRFADQHNHYHWVETVATDMFDEPSVAGIVVNSRDVTQRIENELRLRETVHEFEEQNCRLREISWLQSHVVRAPLARVMGLAELLGYNENDENKKELIDHLKDSANEVDQIIREIIKKSERL
ncbi:PAS domain S-box protein [Pedobacter sp. AW31-3R]|uniref:PAS domain S-box protein n=1 Tax=Pedobacter sp. AW31-3R TaxID=3445781 RepID=UPI003F9FC84A